MKESPDTFFRHVGDLRLRNWMAAEKGNSMFGPLTKRWRGQSKQCGAVVGNVNERIQEMVSEKLHRSRVIMG